MLLHNINHLEPRLGECQWYMECQRREQKPIDIVMYTEPAISEDEAPSLGFNYMNVALNTPSKIAHHHSLDTMIYYRTDTDRITISVPTPESPDHPDGIHRHTGIQWVYVHMPGDNIGSLA
jgi:hypothetical protein